MWSRVRAAAMLLAFVVGGAQAQTRAVSPETPSVFETAQLIGIAPQLQQIVAQEREHPSEIVAGSPEAWKRLWLHQQIYERVAAVELQADATTASIDNEIARAAEVLGFLGDKRDRNVTRANLLSALLGGGLGGVSAGLQLSARQATAAAATGIAGGAISAGLAVYGIHAQRGGARSLDAESNMLARFFGRPELPTSHYPPVIWRFLSDVAPSDPDHIARHERLIHTWLELNRIDSLTSTSGKTKIEHVTSMADQHTPQTIDDLEDRIAMLQDVRAKLSFLKRDMAALLNSIQESSTSAH